MKIYVNERGEIHAVNHSSDPTLQEIEVTDGTFDTWTDAKICCYKVSVENGKVTMLTPYVDSRMIDVIARFSGKTFTKTAYIGDTSVTFSPVPSGNVSVFIDGNYTVSREQDRLTVEFEALTEPKEVTISIL